MPLVHSDGEDESDVDVDRPSNVRMRRDNIRSLVASDDELDDDEEDEGFGRSEDEEEGEDLMENMDKDYERIDDLDRLEEEGLDNEEYEEIAPEARVAAERELNKRDKENKKRPRLPKAIADSDDEAEEDDDFAKPSRRQRQRLALKERVEGTVGTEVVREIQLESFDALPEFLLTQEVEDEIRRRFRRFLTEFHREDGGELVRVYEERIEEMCAKNLQSLLVSYTDLAQNQPQLAALLVDAPKIILGYFDDEATEVVSQRFEHYPAIHEKIHVRIPDLPMAESLRDLRCIHLNSLSKISGVVTRRTSVLPMLNHVWFRCVNPECGQTAGPFSLSKSAKGNLKSITPERCDSCTSKGTMRFDSERTVYGSFQRLTLQESPGTVPAGRVPRQKEVILLDDLIDSARPGEEVEVTGVYVSNVDRGLNVSNGFPVFSTLFEANYVQKKEDLNTALRVTEQDKKMLRKLAQDPRIVDRLIGSIAPSIYGHDKVKTAVALAMFGGREKNIDDKHRVRGDINVLLLGDPGTAKSQCLKYVEKTAPRAVFTTGKGASAVGLTASVHKDPATREWVLEGGALVLADRGVCLIDEFDKMNDRDRTSIHEAMEQQSISISKAGIVTTLQARCSVIAAANPIGGRYDPQRSFAENVELTDPILQRFDVLCVLQDIVNPTDDERLARFVVSSHIKSHPSLASADIANIYQDTARIGQGATIVPGGIIDQETFRKYLLFAKSIKPKLNQSALDQEKIVDVYVQMRKHSAESGGVPIGVRHAESIIRMAEAFARMHLREVVQMDDFDLAIGVMVRSFIDAQRYAVKRTLNRAFSKFVSTKRDYDELLLYLLEDMVRDFRDHREHADEEDTFSLRLGEFYERAKEVSCDRFVADFVESQRFRKAGFRVEGDGLNRIITKQLTVAG